MLPGVRGLRGPLSALNEARFGIIFGVVGAAMACYEAALAVREGARAVRAARSAAFS